MSERRKFEDNQPGMDQKRDVPNDDYQQTRQAALSGEQGRASYNPGSTTQGGSNYGQGSHQLGGESYNQGDQKNAGSNYQDEAGKFSKDNPLGRTPAAATGGETNSQEAERGQLTENRDDIPHGQGAHINEKESNAQEDYPGTEESQQGEEPERDII